MLQGELVLLRGLELDDIDELMKYWNKSEVKQFLLLNVPQSREEEIEWIKQTWEKRKKGESFIFAIVVKEKNLYIGNIELLIQAQTSRRGELGIVIFNTQYWNRGYGAEAINMILEFGFNTLNLNSIELEVFENNLRAISCYKKVGFKEVGKRRLAQFFKGKFIDRIIMDVIASEWVNRESRVKNNN